MKQVSVIGLFLLLLLIVIQSTVCVDFVTNAGEEVTPSTKLVPFTGDSFHINSFTKHPDLACDFSGYAIWANPVSSSSQIFVHVKQVPPIWGRILIIKQSITTSGFFFAAMVIHLFFIFYQNSRTGSGIDSWVIAYH